MPLQAGDSVASLLARAVASDAAYGLLFQTSDRSLPEHVEVVLNERLLDLQGGLDATLKPGDILTFLPAHAGG
jgi:molybdopterin converting factor small subunit